MHDLSSTENREEKKCDHIKYLIQPKIHTFRYDPMKHTFVTMGDILYQSVLSDGTLHFNSTIWLIGISLKNGLSNDLKI